MSDVTIPEAVREAADKALNAAWDEHAELFSPHSNTISDGLWKRFVEHSARAILAERERCAKIADACFADIKGYPHDFGALDTGGLRAAEKIAKAIRSPHPNDEGDGK